MAPRGPQPASTRHPRPRLSYARLVLGAGAAALGLIVALHWIVLPGDHVSLDQKNRRADSVAALAAVARSNSHPNAPDAHIDGKRPTANGRATAMKAHRHATKTAPRPAGKPVVSSPVTKAPGPPTAPSDPATSGGNSPPATETRADNGTSSSPPPPPPPPPPLPPPPPPPGLPQLPQLPQVPQVPVPTVPYLPIPQAPSDPTPPLPNLPWERSPGAAQVFHSGCPTPMPTHAPRRRGWAYKSFQRQHAQRLRGRIGMTLVAWAH